MKIYFHLLLGSIESLIKEKIEMLLSLPILSVLFVLFEFNVTSIEVKEEGVSNVVCVNDEQSLKTKFQTEVTEEGIGISFIFT